MTDIVSPAEKYCPRCQETKSVALFYRNPTHSGGYSTYCKKCEQQLRNTKKRGEFPEGHKRCSTCHEIKPLDQFFNDKNTHDGHGYECKPCHRARINRMVTEFEVSERKRPYRSRAKETLPDGYKRCSRCEEVKPTGEFYVHRQNGNLHPACKSCMLSAQQRKITIPETKRCTVCREVKSYEEFYIHNGKRHKGLTSKCSACSRAYSAKKREEAKLVPYKEVKHRWSQLRKYGLTLEEYEAMLDAQGGVCAACGKPETAMMNGKVMSLCIDHSRVTGGVRGLLCNNCNVALGYLGEDPERAEGLLRYIRERVLY